MWRHLGAQRRHLDGRRVAIVGDVLHSRVARSNALLLHTLGAEVTLVAPPTLLPVGVDSWAVETSYDLDAVLPKADAVMMLRVQRERMNGGVLPDRAGVQPPLRPRRPPDGDAPGPHDRDAPRPDGPRHGDHRRRRRLRPLGDRRAGHQRRRRPDGRALPAARRQPSPPSARPKEPTRDQLPDQGRPDPRRRADRPAAPRRRDRRDRRPASTSATAPRSSTPTGWSRCPAWSTCTPTCASRAARTPRPSRPAPRPPRWAASPPCTRWPTPTRSPTPPASSSRSGGSAARPATATSTRSARSPSGWPGERLAELGAMADSAARVRVFSDDGKCVSDAVLMRRALEYVKAFDGVDRPARPGAAAHRGRPDERGRALRPARPARLAGRRRGGDHRPRLPARRPRRLPAARLPRLDGRVGGDRSAGPRRKGWNVTAEVCPHHLLLTDELAATYDPIYKVNPPLRSAADVEALRAGLADGTIDVVATDHAPHPHEDKDCEWAGRGVRDARPGDRALGRAGDDGRHRPARLGRGRRADVLRARPDRPARRPRPPARGGRARQRGALRPVRTPRWSTPPSRPRCRATRRTPACELPGRVVATFLRGKPTVLDGKLA